MFHYRSNKQDVVAASSTQAELTSSFEAAKEISIYFRDVLEKVGLPEIVPTPLYIDSKSLLKLATNFNGNRQSRKKVKHFLIVSSNKSRNK